MEASSYFRWDILEYLEKEEDRAIFKKVLIGREQYYLEKFKIVEDGVCNKDIGYNLNPVADSRLNTKCSEEAKYKIGEKNRLHWKDEEFRNKINSLRTLNKRKVINLSTGREFNSMVEASKFYNICPTGIGRVCKGEKITSGGYLWAFREPKDSEKYSKAKTKERGKRVKNLSTNKEFSSIKEAAQFYNILGSNIGKVCKGIYGKAYGYKWSFIDDNDLKNTFVYTERYKTKKVINISTGVEFESVAKAARYYNIPDSNIIGACKGKYGSAGGYTWEYLNKEDAGETRIYIEKPVGKRVKNLDTQEEFSSIKEAENYYGMKSRGGIGRVCGGTRKTSGGYRWSFV